MNSLRNSFNLIIHQTARKRKPISEETIARRKELKYLRTQNQFSQDNTGEKALRWTDNKKLRSLAQMYNKFRNTHRHTLNISEQDQQHLKKIGDEHAQYKYWLSLHQRIRHQKIVTIYEEVNKDMELLPHHLKQELNRKINKQALKKFFAFQNEPSFLYWEQLLRIFPAEKTNGYLLAWQLIKDIQEQRR